MYLLFNNLLQQLSIYRETKFQMFSIVYIEIKARNAFIFSGQCHYFHRLQKLQDFLPYNQQDDISR